MPVAVNWISKDRDVILTQEVIEMMLLTLTGIDVTNPADLNRVHGFNESTVISDTDFILITFIDAITAYKIVNVG